MRKLRLLFPTQTLILLVVTLHTSNILFPLIYVFYIMYTPNLGGRLPLLEQLLYYICCSSRRSRSYCSCSRRSRSYCCWLFSCCCCCCCFFSDCCRSRRFFCCSCRSRSYCCRFCCCSFSLSLERRNFY